MASIVDQVIEYARHNPGVVAGTGLAVLLVGITQNVFTAASTSTAGALTTVFEPYVLIDKRQVPHNTRKLRFALPTDTAKLGLPLGRHISLRAYVDGKEVRCPYTPVSSPNVSAAPPLPSPLQQQFAHILESLSDTPAASLRLVSPGAQDSLISRAALIDAMPDPASK